MKNETEIKFVPKGWGYERWIVNNEKYCGKILFFIKGKRCSNHKHKLKEETFYIRTGKLLVKYHYKEDKSDMKEAVLEQNDTFHVIPELFHQMTALEDTEMYEFSTQHFDEDSYRLEKGD